jgi:hypothetical protein
MSHDILNKNIYKKYILGLRDSNEDVKINLKMILK